MNDKTKKVLIIDDSALMRRVVCDIIASDDEFEIADMAADGAQGLIFLSQKSYDVVILDVIMPNVDGITVLKNMRQLKNPPPVVMFSSEVGEGASVTIEALELGAFDFIKKPRTIIGAKKEEFTKRFLQILTLAVDSRKPAQSEADPLSPAIDSKITSPGSRESRKVRESAEDKNVVAVSNDTFPTTGEKIVAIASSTGGPKALQRVIPYLPGNLNAAVLIVQHMPAGFTASLAQRLDEMSEIKVVEAQDGQVLEKGCVYLAKGGIHMEVKPEKGLASLKNLITLKDGPTREGVKPCANYMYESLADTKYDGVVAVVLTGMGRDGTVGIQNLKTKKTVYTVSQDEASCVVYGMPRAVAAAGLANQIEPIDKIAEAITKIVGVN